MSFKQSLGFLVMAYLVVLLYVDDLVEFIKEVVEKIKR